MLMVCNELGFLQLSGEEGVPGKSWSETVWTRERC